MKERICEQLTCPEKKILLATLCGLILCQKHRREFKKKGRITCKNRVTYIQV